MPITRHRTVIPLFIVGALLTALAVLSVQYNPTGATRGPDPRPQIDRHPVFEPAPHLPQGLASGSGLIVEGYWEPPHPNDAKITLTLNGVTHGPFTPGGPDDPGGYLEGNRSWSYPVKYYDGGRLTIVVVSPPHGVASCFFWRNSQLTDIRPSISVGPTGETAMCRI